jgi:sulfide:quinone oxidoreductase
MGKHIVVVGSNFAGMTAAIELKNKLGEDHQVTVVSPKEDFLFMPSLIWVPFGLRKKEDITFALRPVYEKRGVVFHAEAASRIDLDAHKVTTSQRELSYDYLVLATGPKLNYDAVGGLGPRGGFTHSIMSWEDAEQARVALEQYWKNPGPIVIGAVPGASCYGAAYEFLFNTAHQLKKRGLLGKVPLTYVTSEPFLGHFGLGGFGSGRKMTEMFFKKLGIEAVTNAAVESIAPNEISLQDGRTLPFAFSMLVPSFLGVDVVRELKPIVNAKGFVNVNAHYQTEQYPEVFAAGVAVTLDAPQPTDVPCGVPKTGYLSEEMAKIVAHNITALIHEEPLVALPPGSIDAKCVLDAGNTGIIMLGDHFLEPREHAWLIPGPEAHWAKLAFEKYFLATHRRGMV